MAPAVIKTESSVQSATKLPNILEGSAIVETPSAEKDNIGDPMTGVEFTSVPVPLPNGATTQLSG